MSAYALLTDIQTLSNLSDATQPELDEATLQIDGMPALIQTDPRTLDAPYLKITIANLQPWQQLRLNRAVGYQILFNRNQSSWDTNKQVETSAQPANIMRKHSRVDEIDYQKFTNKGGSGPRTSYQRISEQTITELKYAKLFQSWISG
jgi:hypothetical protein